jgi:ubiquinone biosynthesis accessory factor UbiK
MNPLNLLKDMQQKIEELMHNSPAKDLQMHVKTLMNDTFNKLDLITREEFDTQKAVLLQTRNKLDALELQINELLDAKHKH